MGGEQGIGSAQQVAQVAPAAGPDGGGAGAPGEAATAAENAAPQARNDCASTAEGSAIGVPVLQNDGDPDGDALSLLSVSQPDSGRVAISPEGTLTFAPGAAGLHA
ncbi:MAG: Ig-like domain-containing protein, partial [Geminicoccaceae bacterium]